MSTQFKTHDLYFAAYLQVAGVPMLSPERTSSGRINFVFDQTLVNIEDLKNGWYAKTAKVVANDYSHAIKNLKSICHEPK